MYNIFAVNTVIESVLVLVGIAAALIILYFIIRGEIKRYDKDKCLSIDDVADYDSLIKFIKCRAESNKKKPVYFTLMLIGIDDFDQIGEYLSDSGEDEYLFKAMRNLRITIPKGAKFAQAKFKDTFLVYLPEIYEDEEKLLEAGQRYKDAIEKKVKVLGEFYIEKNASAALASYPANGNDIDELLSKLYTAFYTVKKSGGNEIAHYSEEMKSDAAFKRNFERLKYAIENSEFDFAFKPFYNVKDGSCAGCSAKIKWEENGTDYKDMGEYLESSGDEFWFGLWITERTAISAIPVFKSPDVKEFLCEVPFSQKQALKANAADIMQTALNKYSLSPRNFMLSFLGIQSVSGELVKAVTQLKGVGFKICVCSEISETDALSAAKEICADCIKLPISILDKNELSQELNDAVSNKEMALYLTGVNDTQKDIVINSGAKFVEGDFLSTYIVKDQLLDVALGKTKFLSGGTAEKQEVSFENINVDAEIANAKEEDSNN